MPTPVTGEAGPVDEMEHVPCNICSGSESSFVIVHAARSIGESQTEAPRTFRSSGDHPLVDQVVKCTTCGLQYVSPRLKASVIIEEYSRGSDEAFVSQAEGRERTFERCLKTIEKHAGRPGRILDIGTAGGSFLHVASRRGWEVEGCEPNRWLCDWSKRHYGLNIRPGTLDEQRFDAASFDVITLWDVLEHAPDPKAVIRECHRLLKPDGLIVINYPDVGSWAARVMGRSWVFLLSVHLYYFTRTTIARLLTEIGFTVALMRPHFQRLELGYVLKRARPYVGWPASIAERLGASLGLTGRQVPYWVGQTLVIARKSAKLPLALIVALHRVDPDLLVPEYLTKLFGTALQYL